MIIACLVILSVSAYVFARVSYNLDNPNTANSNMVKPKRDVPYEKLLTDRDGILKVQKDIDTIIIGSGIGGLTTATF